MDPIDKPGVEADGSSPAQQALARLAADKSRPGGVTAWCDEHRPDVELVIRELGVPALAQAVGIVDSTLYSWASRRQVERINMRVTRIAPEATASPTIPGETAGFDPWAPVAEPPTRRRRASPKRKVSAPAPPIEGESRDYYRGLAEGLKWAIERLAVRPQ
mgnify:CR=1 FL=1